MSRFPRISFASAALALSGGLVISACSSSNSDGSGSGNFAGSAGHSAHGGASSAAAGSSAQPGGGSSSGGNGSLGSGGSSVSSGAGTSGVISSVACPGLPFTDSGAGGEGGASDEACTGVSVEAESVPVDLFIMMDRSQSMGFTLPNSTLTRWDALKQAVQSFVSAPSAGAIGAGIGFFSISGGGDDTLDCSVANYEKPAVGIGPLSTTGPELVKAIDAIPPAGLTPTVPALQGAIAYAQDWAT
jgi:hypothetical protein